MSCPPQSTLPYPDQGSNGINTVFFYSATIFGLAGFNQGIIGEDPHVLLASERLFIDSELRLLWLCQARRRLRG